MTELVLKRFSDVSPAVWSFLRSVWMLVIAIPIAVAIMDPDKLQPVLTKAIGAFAHTLPFIAFA
ncbi:MAG: hypothetical protein AAFU50_07450, partial [Pseudomonadota bacterium]